RRRGDQRRRRRQIPGWSEDRSPARGQPDEARRGKARGRGADRGRRSAPHGRFPLGGRRRAALPLPAAADLTAAGASQTMKRGRDRILTTHAGSLPRPDDLIELNRARQAGEPTDERAYEERLGRAVEGTVERQRAVGIDIANDGEYGKAM